MKSVTLRTLLREPLKVKSMTQLGDFVQVTDNGKPLWILQPAQRGETDEAERRREIEAELADIAKSPKSSMPLTQILRASRR